MPTTPRRKAQPRYVVKPTPATYFTYRGQGAREMSWGRLTAANEVVSNAHFYVHNRTPPPRLDPDTWRLEVSGPPLNEPRYFSYADLLAMPPTSVVSVMECAANGRRFFPKLAPPDSGTWLPIAGSEWRFGAVGAATWTGARLRDVLQAAGIDQNSAVDVLISSLDGVQYSHVVPAERAYADDSLLVYSMNEKPLPPDHGFPCRAFFSGWGGNSDVKWVGSITVSPTPLPLPDHQTSQVLKGPGYPPDGEVVTVQNVNSALELDWDATLPLPENGVIELSGRAWSGAGLVVSVEVCVQQEVERGKWQPVWDPPWRPLELQPYPPAPAPAAWARFTLEWSDAKAGHYQVMSRATDDKGNVQPDPDEVAWNEYGLLYNGHVGYPITLVPAGVGCVHSGEHTAQ